ncbi:CLUMA_CG002015, isoform A [Clunio marinus]|uniref:CLUMA_CG002015, isoform A n=1 Tax=Clunio marinus TaxID=568069 RepID=A0A1J1HL21_9DIPT|nr:CLUMA_CG002015, isoform A [Clunio marinus]
MSVGNEEIIDWQTEATAVINDVKQHVKAIAISEKLITDVGIYINLQTLEGKEFTCFLDAAGFKIVGFNYDCCDNEDTCDDTIYETIYALIQSHSPAYTQSFGNALVDKLTKLS